MILAIDPGRSTGLAVVDDGRLIHHSQASAKTIQAERDRLAHVLRVEVGQSPGPGWLLVVEDQYAAPGASSIALAHTAGRWQAHAAALGLDGAIWCQPPTWQRWIGCKARARDGIAVELRQILGARGIPDLGPDADSAVGLALWGHAHPDGGKAEKRSAKLARAEREVQLEVERQAREARKTEAAARKTAREAFVPGGTR